MKTRIKVTELDGEIRNIAQSKGYGKIENFFDFMPLSDAEHAKEQKKKEKEQAKEQAKLKTT